MPKRQTAKRLFITEILNTHEQVEKDGTKFAITPLGDEVNRVFLVATILECRDNGETIRLRLADPTGGMSVWISNKTPELQQKAAELAEEFSLVAISGKLRVVNETFTTVRVEKIGKADETTRRLWVRDAVRRVKKLLNNAKDENFAKRMEEHVREIEMAEQTA
ncbi:hypothetical protein [Archaeoglobus neptunius]|uniref:hypothetical protein n=1 Tax=Archaeoglobus neptunius TaxID=2798580 RepID=UPI001926F7C7|nr:hypothetical protein [Archaeoglobus neptunius]